jgi:hypothetical protein
MFALVCSFFNADNFTPFVNKVIYDSFSQLSNSQLICMLPTTHICQVGKGIDFTIGLFMLQIISLCVHCTMFTSVLVHGRLITSPTMPCIMCLVKAHQWQACQLHLQ